MLASFPSKYTIVDFCIGLLFICVSLSLIVVSVSPYNFICIIPFMTDVINSHILGAGLENDQSHDLQSGMPMILSFFPISTATIGWVNHKILRHQILIPPPHCIYTNSSYRSCMNHPPHSEEDHYRHVSIYALGMRILDCFG